MISENLRCQSMMSPARDYQERYQCGWTPGSAEPTKCSNIWALCENVEYSSYWWQAGIFQLSMKRENIFFAFHEKGECLGYQCKGEIRQLCLHDEQCRVDRSCLHTWGKQGGEPEQIGMRWTWSWTLVLGRVIKTDDEKIGWMTWMTIGQKRP